MHKEIFRVFEAQHRQISELSQRVAELEKKIVESNDSKLLSKKIAKSISFASVSAIRLP